MRCAPRASNGPNHLGFVRPQGDFIVMPEALTHGVSPWLPADRARRTLMLRYQLQTMPPHNNPPIGPPILARCVSHERFSSLSLCPGNTVNTFRPTGHRIL